jgi:hypothetical protein
VLRLRPEQVRAFLQRTGVGSLYDRMPSELRDLAGDPFMLVAITRTLAGTTEAEMPRNRGRLNARFVTPGCGGRPSAVRSPTTSNA